MYCLRWIDVKCTHINQSYLHVSGYYIVVQTIGAASVARHLAGVTYISAYGSPIMQVHVSAGSVFGGHLSWYLGTSI